MSLRPTGLTTKRRTCQRSVAGLQPAMSPQCCSLSRTTAPFETAHYVVIALAVRGNNIF